MEQILTAVERAIQNEQDELTDGDLRLTRIYGGMNGIIYRVNDWCVKVRKRDERNRALREHQTLQALDGFSVAPEPLGYYPNLDTFPGDVVISTWVDGVVLDDLSDAPFDVWERIMTTLSIIHSITPDVAPHITDAVVPTRSTDDLVAEIERRLSMLSDGQLGHITKAEMGLLWEKFKSETTPHHSTSDGLIVCDVNSNNLIDDGEHVLIVDWENAGWGDPAIDMADLLVRPNFVGLPDDKHMRIIEIYANGDSAIIERILAYERLMQFMWLILSTRGFSDNQPERFKGTRQHSLETMLSQQKLYLERIS